MEEGLLRAKADYLQLLGLVLRPEGGGMLVNSVTEIVLKWCLLRDGLVG